MPSKRGGKTGSQRKAAKVVAEAATKSTVMKPLPKCAGKPLPRSNLDAPQMYKVFTNPSLVGCVKGAIPLTEAQVRDTSYANKAGFQRAGIVRYVSTIELPDNRLGQQGSLTEAGTSPPRCYNFREYRGKLWTEGDAVTFEMTSYKGKDARLVGTGVAIQLSRSASK